MHCTAFLFLHAFNKLLHTAKAVYVHVPYLANTRSDLSSRPLVPGKCLNRMCFTLHVIKMKPPPPAQKNFLSYNQANTLKSHFQVSPDGCNI